MCPVFLLQSRISLLKLAAAEMAPTIVNLNVGGYQYSTSLRTLTKFEDSMLATMFNGNMPTAQDRKGNYFIDRNGELFDYVLEFLRSGKLNLPADFKSFEKLKSEADFYQIEPLIEAVETQKTIYMKGNCSIYIALELLGETLGGSRRASLFWRPSLHAIEVIQKIKDDRQELPAAYTQLSSKKNPWSFNSEEAAAVALASLGAKKTEYNDITIYEIKLDL